MKKVLLWLFMLIVMQGIYGCASSPGKADKETHVAPQQTNTLTLTLPASTGVPTNYHFHGPLVSVKQEMKIEDFTAKGGDQDGQGGEADQTTEPVTDLQFPIKIPDIPVIKAPDIPIKLPVADPVEPPVAPVAVVEILNLSKFLDDDGNVSNGGKVYSWGTIKGFEFPGPIEVSVEGYDQKFLILNPSVKWTPDGNTSNHNQFVYFPGDDPDQDTHPRGYYSIVLGPDMIDATKATVTNKPDILKYSQIKHDPGVGTGIVQCPGDQKWDSCSVGGQNLKYHGLDGIKHSWWDETITDQTGPITCKRGDDTFIFDYAPGVKEGSC